VFNPVTVDALAFSFCVQNTSMLEGAFKKKGKGKGVNGYGAHESLLLALVSFEKLSTFELRSGANRARIALNLE
jgi:hypothetical protein